MASGLGEQRASVIVSSLEVRTSLAENVQYVQVSEPVDHMDRLLALMVPLIRVEPKLQEFCGSQLPRRCFSTPR
jgi:hypothetical protein